MELSKRVALRLGNLLDALEDSDDPAALMLEALAGEVADPVVLARRVAARFALGDPEALIAWLRALDQAQLDELVTELIETRSLERVRHAVGVSSWQ